MAGRLVAVHHSGNDHKGRNGHQRQVPRTRIRNRYEILDAGVLRRRRMEARSALADDDRRRGRSGADILLQLRNDEYGPLSDRPQHDVRAYHQ